MVYMENPNSFHRFKVYLLLGSTESLVPFQEQDYKFIFILLSFDHCSQKKLLRFGSFSVIYKCIVLYNECTTLKRT